MPKELSKAVTPYQVNLQIYLKVYHQDTIHNVYQPLLFLIGKLYP